MAYTAQFKSLRGETYTVEITCGGSGELTLSGDDPVTIEYEHDDIFKPLKMSACSVKVLTTAPLLSLYTGTLNGVTCSVKRGSDLIWFGFLTPNVYSSGYRDVWDEMTLEFVDPLSAMENVKFKYFGDAFFSTFNQYISKALSEVGAKGMSISGIPSELNYMGVMQRNFIDETDDEDDGAMTWQEVMESILRYMNRTAYCDGMTLRIYDPLDTSGTSKKIGNGKNEIGIAECNGTISMGELYNKVSVLESTNPIDDILDSELIDDANMEEFMDYHHQYYKNKSTYGATMGFYAVPMAIKEKETDTDTVDYVDLRAVFTTKSPWTCNVDVDHSQLSEDYIQPFNDSDGKAPWHKFAPDVPGVEGMTMGAGAFVLYNDYYKYGFPPTSISWDKSLLFYINRLTEDSQKYSQMTFLKYNSESKIVMKGGYIIISLAWEYLTNCMTKLEKQYVYERRTCGAKSCVDEWNVILRVGNKYWNGDQWTTVSSGFTMEKTWKQGTNIYGSEVKIDNKASYEYGLRDTSEGWLIPVNDELFGDIEIRLCPPTGMCTGFDGVTPTPRCAKITELKAVYTTTKNTVNGALNEDTDNDIVLCNLIDDANIKEAEDVQFNTNTWSELQNSYSYVIKKDGLSYKYYIPTPIPEKTCIERMVNYYSSPRLRYSNTLKDRSGKHISPADLFTITNLDGYFAVGSISYKLATDSADVTLVEVPETE